MLAKKTNPQRVQAGRGGLLRTRDSSVAPQRGQNRQSSPMGCNPLPLALPVSLPTSRVCGESCRCHTRPLLPSCQQTTCPCGSSVPGISKSGDRVSTCRQLFISWVTVPRLTSSLEARACQGRPAPHGDSVMPAPRESWPASASLPYARLSTSRTFLVRSCGVNGLCRKARPDPLVPACVIISSVYPEM